MGLREKLKKIFRRESKIEALQSDLKRFNSDLKRSNERFEALQSGSDLRINEEKHKENRENYENTSLFGLSQLSHKPEKTIELQKESLQLGVAAGYTGKTIKQIESSLDRIERQMISKEWFTSSFGNKANKTLEMLANVKKTLENHDSSASKRLEALQSALKRLSKVAETAPEPIKKEMISEIEAIESNLPLTPKMKTLVNTIKEHKKLSYDDLVQSLGVTRSSLRGLITNTLKRTDEIERFSVDGKGWLRYKYPKTTQISDN